MTRNRINKNTGNEEWYTPAEYIESARLVMGSITLDPASCKTANAIVKAEKYYTKHENGLLQKWHGRLWINPPYTQPSIQRFCEKLIQDLHDEYIEQACVLISNATETKHGQLLLSNCDAVCFLSGRVNRFWSDAVDVSRPLQGHMIVYFGERSTLFCDEFKQHGVVLMGFGIQKNILREIRMDFSE